MSTLKIGDLTIHRLGFGAMRLCGKGVWGPPTDRDNAKRVLRRAVELGVNFIDTADAYGPYVDEELIAEALHPYAKGLVIATKGGLTRSGPGDWSRNAQPQHLRQACEGSLKRLRLERIDLYQLHAVDPRVPLEDSVGELAKLQSEGKIRHVGISNVSVDELKRAQNIVPIVSVQNAYNITDRSSEAVLGACAEHGIAFLPYFPIAAGKEIDHGNIDAVAKRHAKTPRQIALAWLLAHSKVNVPIPGTSSLAHLEENVAAADIQLTPEEVSSLG